jgi:hypothetical protein
MPLEDFPKSYRDPQYAQLDTATEQKLGLPPGMVQAIRTEGERTDSDKVSTTGARTPYQFTPTTRRLVLDKYGVDAYLSPANASEAAGLLLQESLKRNKDDPEAAVREYHGGTNRDNWGKQNEAYWSRVAPALENSKVDALSANFAKWNKANPASPAAPTPNTQADPVSQKLLDGFSAWKQGQDLIPGTTLPANRQPVSTAMPQAPAPQAPGIMDTAIGSGEAILNAATGMVGGTIGMVGGTAKGLAQSVANGTYGTQEGVKSVEQSAAEGANALTYQPRTQSGQDQAAVVGEGMQALLPVAAVAHTLPPIAEAIRPAAGVAKDGVAAVMDRAASAIPQAVRDVTGKTGEQIAPPVSPNAVQPLPPAELATVARKAAGGSSKAEQVLAEQAAPDPAIVKSAQRLGIENDLQPDHVTTNESYRQVSSALKSINPGSALSIAEREGLGRIAERANNLVDEIGGTRDLSGLDASIKSRMTDTVAGLEKQADALYSRLREEIPATTRAPASNALEFINKRASELGGTEMLSPMEKRVLSRLSPKEVATKEVVPGNNLMPGSMTDTTRLVRTQEHPTYARLDDVRRDVGSALKMQGPFKDADAGLAKKIYSLLSADQEKVVASTGMGDVFAAAKKAVELRKGIEDDLTALFGKNLDRSFVGGGQIGLPGAISNLAKGDSSQLTRLISAIPEDMRQTVVASGLATALRKASTRGELMDFTGYAKWYEGLRTNRKAYAAVMSNLPLSARKQLASLYNVSKGVSDSLNRRTKTGAIGTIREELLGKDTMVTKLYDIVKGSAAGATVGTVVGAVMGSGAGAAAASFLTKSKPRSVAAVDALIVSPEFAQLVRSTAGSKEQAIAVKKVAASPKFIAVMRAAKGSIPKLSEREQWILENMRPVPIQQQDRHQGSRTLH